MSLFKLHKFNHGKIKGSHIMMSNIKKNILKLGILLFLSSFIFSGCAAVHSARLQEQCSSGLAIANAELNKAKVQGFSSTVAWTKAAALLGAATIQQEFNKFPNCINKVARARYHIKRSKRK